jgi:hypothetical protein
VDNEAAHGGAALPGGSRRREHNTAEREIQVRAGSDNRGIVTAQLEKGTAEAPGDQRAMARPMATNPVAKINATILVLHETLARERSARTSR